MVRHTPTHRHNLLRFGCRIAASKGSHILGCPIAACLQKLPPRHRAKPDAFSRSRSASKVEGRIFNDFTGHFSASGLVPLLRRIWPASTLIIHHIYGCQIAALLQKLTCRHSVAADGRSWAAFRLKARGAGPRDSTGRTGVWEVREASRWGAD